LSNALKFTPAGGTIALELSSVQSPDGQQALLRVRDTGPGVAAEDRERIFQRFSQGTSGKEQRAAGTGLGLAIVRELIELHGGSVSVGDATGGGALFEARWPLLAPANRKLVPNTPQPVHSPRELSLRIGSAPHRTVVSLPEREHQTDEAERASVLVVDDNSDMRSLLTEVLEPRYRVLEARNGEEALANVRSFTPDLIISDVMMPKLSGEELVYSVRKLPVLDGVPILLLTAKADEALRARVLRLGAQDYLLKPFDREELLARVHNLVAIRRTHVLLQSEVEAQQGDVEALSREVIHQKRKLESALVVMQQAREEAERSNRQKSDFLSLVSHELRTPLTSIRLQVERLNRGRAGELNHTQLEIIAKIERSSARLLNMVESLLQFGRLETGRLQVSSAPFDVLDLAREVIDELSPRAEQKGLLLRLETALENAPLVSDMQLVRLILVNLCDNAIKYTSSGSIIVLLQRRSDGALCIKVTDTGQGIAASAHERVFLPFEQLEHVRHKQGAGVGLGLALVKRVAEALRAEVGLHSVEGQGSVFSVTFPGRELG
ncbi:MAG TPA: ATP-binding protein, partial [Polyangiales bacterium]